MDEQLRAVLQTAQFQMLPVGLAESPDAIALGCAPSPRELGNAFARIRSIAPQAPIVVICADGGSRAVRAILESGAAGMVLEHDIERALAPTLAATAANQSCFPMQPGGEVQRPLLSMREKQVLGMVVLGFSNGEIAARLFVADTTIKSHLNSAYRKLGVRNRGEAAAAILDPDGGLGTGILTIDTEDDDARAGGRAQP